MVLNTRLCKARLGIMYTTYIGHVWREFKQNVAKCSKLIKSMIQGMTASHKGTQPRSCFYPLIIKLYSTWNKLLKGRHSIITRSLDMLVWVFFCVPFGLILTNSLGIADSTTEDGVTETQEDLRSSGAIEEHGMSCDCTCRRVGEDTEGFTSGEFQCQRNHNKQVRNLFLYIYYRKSTILTMFFR